MAFLFILYHRAIQQTYMSEYFYVLNNVFAILKWLLSKLIFLFEHIFIYLIIMRKVNNQAKRKIFYLLDFIFTLQTEILPLLKHIP